jgi:D-inositol-3-phosphate glycosyltransferase
MSLILLSSQKKIVTVHSTDTIQRIRFLYKLYNRVDKIIVHSESMKTYLIKNGVSRLKLAKVFHGVDIPHLYGLERTKITFMGAPEERKGILTILDALKILKRKNIKIQVSIYGFYSDYERKKTELQATSRNVDDCLVWGGRLSEKEFDKKLQESLFTLAVYNSATSGSNLVTRAMANATPVIASDIGGLREYLDEGGIFLPPRNPEALAETIELLLKKPELLEELGSKGRKRALTFFSREEIAKRTASIYRSLISDNR